jgi:hypothetical protein
MLCDASISSVGDNAVCGVGGGRLVWSVWRVGNETPVAFTYGAGMFLSKKDRYDRRAFFSIIYLSLDDVGKTRWRRIRVMHGELRMAQYQFQLYFNIDLV